MLVKQWMSSNPISISRSLSLSKAAEILKTHGFRRLPVMEKQKLVGILSDRDIRSAQASDASSLSVHELTFLLDKLSVERIMSKTVYSISPQDSIYEAVRLMLEKKISGLPVLDNGSLVGMLTTSDILKAFLSLENKQDPLESLKSVHS